MTKRTKAPARSNVMRMRHVRMVDALWEKASALGATIGGASEWIRRQIAAAPLPSKTTKGRS